MLGGILVSATSGEEDDRADIILDPECREGISDNPPPSDIGYRELTVHICNEVLALWRPIGIRL